MSVSKTSVANTYFDQSGFLNTKISAIISLFNYFGDFIFPNDPTRIIYAKNEFAFRRRLQLQKHSGTSAFHIQNLNFPFINFSLDSISESTDREWKNFPLELHGAMDWDINKKIRMSPMKLSFEATFWAETEPDIHYFMSEIMWDNALETILYPEIDIDGVTFKNIGKLSYSPNYNPQFSESDWLEQNRVRTVTFDFELDTFLLKATTDGFWIPKTVLFSFATTHNLEIHDWEDYDLLLEGVIDFIEKEVVF